MESNFELIFEPQFTKDYRKLKKEHPELISDLRGNYNGNQEYHLSN